MSQPVFTVNNLPKRSRVSVFFRMLLAIPHLFVVSVWQFVINIVTFVQWWIILFTGKRNEGIWRMQSAWLGYACRVHGYMGLLYDKYPAFGAEPAGEPTSYSFEYSAPARRLTNFFRFIMVIPAAFVAIFVLIGAEVVLFLSWFAIVITGKHPQGMFGYSLRVHQFMARLNAYTMYMTDDYPKFAA